MATQEEYEERKLVSINAHSRDIIWHKKVGYNIYIKDMTLLRIKVTVFYIMHTQ